ncbi:MAG: hypothetical protein RBR86_01185 [Pseudobdellovibrionaceae bacterium]|jgi:hypothetical protein|nr:hypothetical protein [Pseudobdellovibrionaceae bacterium]
MSHIVRTKTLKTEALRFKLASIASGFSMAASVCGVVYQVGMIGDSYQNLSSLREAERSSLQSIDFNVKQKIEARPTLEWLKLAGASGAALVLAGATVGFGLGAARRYDALRMRGL